MKRYESYKILSKILIDICLFHNNFKINMFFFKFRKKSLEKIPGFAFIKNGWYTAFKGHKTVVQVEVAKNLGQMSPRLEPK